MPWHALLDPDIRAFINDNINADPASLALKKWPNDTWPKTLILDQIKSRQKAKSKNPIWLQNADLILPPPSIIEQASSHATATFKASLAKGHSFADLTGGTGSDCIAFMENFNEGYCIEKEKNLANLLEHNLPRLSTKTIKIHCTNAAKFIEKMPKVDCTFIDPARRTTNKKGIYKLEDCSPNIIDLLPSLHKTAKKIIVKTSPMLDIQQGIADLKNVTDVYVIEYKGDCKELLFVLESGAPTKTVTIHAVILQTDGTAKHHITSKKTSEIQYSDPQSYLYEPSPALQKAQILSTLCAQYSLKQLAPSTNLLTSVQKIEDFPGRSFKIIAQYPPHKKSIPIRKANLTIRNFPSTVEMLKKKFNLQDGGHDFLFACSLLNGKKYILHGRKL